MKKSVKKKVTKKKPVKKKVTKRKVTKKKPVKKKVTQKKVTKKKVTQKKVTKKKPVKKKVTQKKVIKKRDTKKLLKIKRNIEKLKKLDKRKLTKEQKKYVKQLLKKHKEEEFERKFTKYLSDAVLMYLTEFQFDKKSIFELLKQAGISKNVFKKITIGKKVSKESYKKFMNFVTQNFSTSSQSVLWRILSHLKAYGKISKKKLREIIDEIIELVSEEKIDLDMYDILRVYY